MDIRLKTKPYEFAGKTYILSCNMGVLADVQEAHDGNLLEALNGVGSLKTALCFLAAMLNDYADSEGWEERYTARQVGRMLSPTPTNVRELTDLVVSLVRGSIAPAEEEQEEPVENDEKN